MQILAEYIINQFRVTGTMKSIQAVRYDSLTDAILGTALPESFDQAPVVDVLSPYGQYDIFTPADYPPETEQFYITRGSSNPMGETNFYCNLRIKNVVYSYNFNEMVWKLGILLNDRLATDFDVTLKSLMLNDAMDKFIVEMREYYGSLHEIETPETGVTLDSTSGYFAITSLDNTMFDGIGGIQEIKITGGKRCRQISYNEHLKNEQVGKVYSLTRARYYILGNNIYILPFTAGDDTTIDITYLKQQPKMVVNSVDCPFDRRKRKIITGLACEDFIDKTDAAKRAYEFAREDMATLQTTYSITESNEEEIISEEDETLRDWVDPQYTYLED